MRTITILVALAAACGGSPDMMPAPETTTDGGRADGGSLVLHSAYTCTSNPDAGADEARSCISDFKSGSGSDCTYTCLNGKCTLVRPVGGGYDVVAVCVAP